MAWIACSLLTGSARAMDLELYGALLERHTVAVDDIASTRVDYGALAKSADWDRLVRSLAASDPEQLASRAEKLAFWINAYNVLAIEIVRRHHPIDGIRSIGSLFSPVWKRPAGSIGGRDYTLDEIEHRILRPMGEPRIHAAIVCASNSCPPLRREPYRADRLDAQLDDNVGRWLADPRKGARVDRAAKTLWLSPILDWFEEDFREGVVPFVARHAPPPVAEWIREQGPALRIRHFDYDWSLNDIRASGAPGAQSRLDRSPGPKTRPDRHDAPPAGPGAGSRT
ncbi:MAG: DUF547 domain-containing protein [Myxococcota bacterium]